MSSLHVVFGCTVYVNYRDFPVSNFVAVFSSAYTATSTLGVLSTSLSVSVSTNVEQLESL